MEQIRPHVKVGSSHDAAVRRGALVSRAHAHHEAASLRSRCIASGTRASDAFVTLFTFQTAQIFPFPRRIFAPGVCRLTFTHPPNRRDGRSAEGRILLSLSRR